jgi:hypothetical protein
MDLGALDTRGSNTSGDSTSTGTEDGSISLGTEIGSTSPGSEGGANSAGTDGDSNSAGADGGSAPSLGDRNSTSGFDPRLADDSGNASNADNASNGGNASNGDNASNSGDAQDDDEPADGGSTGTNGIELGGTGTTEQAPREKTVGERIQKTVGRIYEWAGGKADESDKPTEKTAVAGVRGREAEGGENLGPTPEQLKEKLASQNGGADGTTNPTGATPVLSQEEAAGALRSQAGTPDVLIQTQEGAIEEGSLDAGVSAGVQPGAIDPDETE